MEKIELVIFMTTRWLYFAQEVVGWVLDFIHKCHKSSWSNNTLLGSIQLRITFTYFNVSFLKKDISKITPWLPRTRTTLVCILKASANCLYFLLFCLFAQTLFLSLILCTYKLPYDIEKLCFTSSSSQNTSSLFTLNI